MDMHGFLAFMSGPNLIIHILSMESQNNSQKINIYSLNIVKFVYLCWNEFKGCVPVKIITPINQNHY